MLFHGCIVLSMIHLPEMYYDFYLIIFNNEFIHLLSTYWGRQQASAVSGKLHMNQDKTNHDHHQQDNDIMDIIFKGYLSCLFFLHFFFSPL